MHYASIQLYLHIPTSAVTSLQENTCNGSRSFNALLSDLKPASRTVKKLPKMQYLQNNIPVLLGGLLMEWNLGFADVAGRRNVRLHCSPPRVAVAAEKLQANDLGFKLLA